MIISNWKKLFASMNYFLKLIFFTKEYDVVFVSSVYFNRGHNGENALLKPMIESCKKNNLNFVIFEDADLKGEYKNFRRSNNSIPFDFISLLQVILRKFFNLIYKNSLSEDENYIREYKISNVLKNFFFRKFNSKVYITLLWNNITLWRSIDPDSCVVDYQHGVIYDGHLGYIKDGRPPKIKSANDIVTLVYGQGFKDILLDSDKSNFYGENNVLKVGIKKEFNFKNLPPGNNRKILFSLQIVPGLDVKLVNNYINNINKLITFNKDFLTENNYKIIFRHHPRYTTYNCPKINFEEDFIDFDNQTPILDLLDTVSMHMTFHSTSVFDAAMIGIPSIFIDMLEEMSPEEIFLNQYKYPCKDMIIKDYKDLEKILLDLDNKEIFINNCHDVYQWSQAFYNDFDEKIFEDFLSKKVNKYNLNN
tara:strand:- start:2235 stop:3494 length:1260 start_codon:yes stop_codon:yes gene_type:complete